ncbi:Na+/alanine symporter [Metabacillus crassostreae]|uniref:hypothetical protein n=1 Tax=Metabacillus crassostreae TaxID=929098 RepID=UPI0019580A87|nr:hypothetical protein [Metabacillus crassostreae]MBM7602448.1 Na+/alanine symporter [Metabacillus crassostreae]
MKFTGYVSMLLAIILFGFSTINFFFVGDRRGSFIQETFGIYEPVGTLLCLLLVLLFFSLSLNLVWNLSYKSIFKLSIISLMLIFLLPIILMVFFAGQI